MENKNEVTSYWTDKGDLAFVYSTDDARFQRYYTATMRPRTRGQSEVPARLYDKGLPTRYTEREAKKDLDAYAREKGWKPAY